MAETESPLISQLADEWLAECEDRWRVGDRMSTMTHEERTRRADQAQRVLAFLG